MKRSAGKSPTLLEIVRQLRLEIAWASRTGLEYTVAPPPPIEPTQAASSFLETEVGKPAKPNDGGELSQQGEVTQEELPPAFAPDPVETEALEPQGVQPQEAKRRAVSDRARPWEQYIEDSEDPYRNHLRTASSLEQVKTILGDCKRCKLHSGRKNIVFGVGHPQADIMFVGEGPGQQEDVRGEPFVGEAGQLLTRIIENGMKLPRQSVYIANIVKCRPPRNRDPEPDEVEACEPFLAAQIKQVKPRVIVALGRYAAQTLLRNKTPITRLRGTWHTYEGIDLMPTFHPAYLLRNPEGKRPVWEDIQAVMQRLKEASKIG